VVFDRTKADEGDDVTITSVRWSHLQSESHRAHFVPEEKARERAREWKWGRLSTPFEGVERVDLEKEVRFVA